MGIDVNIILKESNKFLIKRPLYCPPPEAIMDDEGKALELCVLEFSSQMKKKLIEKLHCAYEGWAETDPQTKDVLLRKLMNNLLDGDMIDVANLAMFIWNVNKGKKMPIGLKIVTSISEPF